MKTLKAGETAPPSHLADPEVQRAYDAESDAFRQGSRIG
jgi:hypothetical protein